MKKLKEAHFAAISTKDMRKTKLFAAFLSILLLCSTNLFSQISQQDQAQINDYKQRIEKAKTDGNSIQAIEYASKLAFLYWETNQLQPALESFNQALELNKKVGNENGIKRIRDNMGMIYIDLSQYQNAVECFLSNLELCRKQNQKEDIASELINIASTYKQFNQPEKSVKYASEAVSYARENKNLKQLRSCYLILAESYKKLGNNEKSIENMELFASVDKFFTNQELDEKNQQVNQLQSQTSRAEMEILDKDSKLKSTTEVLMKTEKISKEQKLQIQLLDQEKKTQELIVAQQEDALRYERRVKYLMLAGGSILMVFIILLLFLYKKIRSKNDLLATQNIEIKHKNEEIEHQKEKVEEQNKKITDSIRYAKKIQAAILPFKEDFDRFFESIILYRPKDIVSGDFFWHSFIGTDCQSQKLLIAVVDCTGHGVPGALMSMLGNTYLSQIVNEKEIIQPEKILENLNLSVRKGLKQQQTDNEDGMDVCLCQLEKLEGSKWKLVYSGAKRPLFIFQAETEKINTLKGDRRSVGGILNKKEEPFTSQEIILQKGDTLYLTSDGLIDQSAPDRRRFGTGKLTEILEKTASLSLSEQQKCIENELSEFQQGEEQRDDITLIGIRIR